MVSSSFLTADRHRALIRRFTTQPEVLPPGIRTLVESTRGKVCLYALVDLDAAFQLQADWWVLTDSHLVRVSSDDKKKGEWKSDAVSRGDIRSVREQSGLSSSWLGLYGEADRLLMEARVSNRQRRSLEHIRFVLQQQIEGHPVLPSDPDAVYAEAVAGPIREAQSSVARNQVSVIWRLLGYFRPYKKEVTIGFAAAVIMTLLNLAPPWFTKFLLDDILKPVEDGRMTGQEMLPLAFTVIGALGALHLIREVSAWFRLRKLAYLGEYVAHDLRQEIYAHLQKLSLNFFSKKQTGSIITRVSSDTDRLWEFLAFGVVEASLSIIMLVGLGVVLITMDVQLGLIMTLPVPLFLAAYYFHGKAINHRFLKAWRKWSDVSAVLSDTIPGMRVVKSFSQEDREKNRFNRRNDIALEAFNEVHASWTTFWPVLMFFFHMITLAVWGLAVVRLLGAWGAPLSLGTFIAFSLYMGLFFYPLEVIGQITRMMNRAVSSAHRVFEIIDTEPQVLEVENPRKIERIEGRIRFENLSFSYDGVRKTLRNLSFEIQPGEMIGLVGPSGAGKSTIINLLARFYDATDGRILIDGEDLHGLDLSHYRRQLGIVQQEPFLFHGPVLDNIRYGMPEATLGQVVEAARAANAHDFICKMPLGYETVVGERGHTLSGGERQRVSIARAILHNPRILILDEATSNVDTETERKIQEALDRLVQGRTVVAIAHRLSTLQKADRLLVIKNGVLVEEGTHAQLLNMNEGVYKKLHDLQQELHAQFAV
jgi:ATP-binding cassette, subfamily B, bacterial